MFKNKIISISLILIFLTGCMTGSGLTDAQIDYYAHWYQMLEKTRSQQTLFRNEIEPDMSKSEVRELVISIANRVPDGWHKEGNPTSRRFETIEGQRYEIWEYDYLSAVFILYFQDDKLYSFDEREQEVVIPDA